MKRLLLALLWIGCTTFAWSQTISPTALQSHINILASDSLEGRGTATLGEIKAANYIARQFQNFGLQPAGVENSFFQPFLLQQTIDHFTHLQTSRNVIGFLDNGAEKTVVIGAHYDHLGYGWQGGSREPYAVDQIHNGAEHNASGTAGLLELAKFLSQNPTKERFNFLFIDFSAEELGLIGSKYFVSNPTIPLESIGFMINMDMIGRYEDARGLTIGGWGTSSWWGKLLPDILSQESLKIKIDSSGIGPSDHTSFYNRNIPVLFFFTGAHNDYHKTVDDADKINAEGAAKVLHIITQLIDALEKEEGYPDYIQANNPHKGNTTTSFKVTLGVMPDYSFSGKGLKIDGITTGRPAEKAGLRVGDIITKIGAYTIDDIYDYMEILNKHEKEQRVTIEFLRGNELHKSEATF